MNGSDAARRILAARTALVLDEPFFGALALRLDVVADPSCDTAWTDGVRLGYSPDFVAGLTHGELVALLAHEVMHCAMGHPWRRDGREPRRWNGAADYAVNPILTDAGFTLPDGALSDPSFRGRSAEWIYDRLPEPDPDGDDGDDGSDGDDSDGSQGGQDGDGGQGAGDGGQDGPTDATGAPDGPDGPDPGQGAAPAPAPDPLGEIRDAPTPAEDPDAPTEQEWKQSAATAAAMARARGELPGALDRLVSDRARPRVDWRATLRRFVQDRARNDYTWSRPNPRYLARGLYLPALHTTELGPLVVAVDTSGSVDGAALDQMAAELRAIVGETDPARVHVWYADTDVRRRDTFERGEPLTLRPVGGGGTDFRPVFRALSELPEPPAAVVYLTDLAGTFPDRAPGVPTLWAFTGPWRPPPVPFGDVVRVE